MNLKQRIEIEIERCLSEDRSGVLLSVDVLMAWLIALEEQYDPHIPFDAVVDREDKEECKDCGEFVPHEFVECPECSGYDPCD